MKGLYFDTTTLDKRANKIFGLDNRVLMENAASAVESLVRKKLRPDSRVLALCGTGNNANDAICTLRKLSGDYECVAVLCLGTPKNEMYKIQNKCAKIAGVKFTTKITFENFENFDCIIDGIFGSGLTRELNGKICEILSFVNRLKALKIAVDIPSGLNMNGVAMPRAFKADYTVTMGAYKTALFGDDAKNYVGKIKLANLGISREKYEDDTFMHVLEKSDLRLPFRENEKQNVNKGDFGHAYILVGDMSGAAQIAALSAHAIGVGLVSLVSLKGETLNLNPILMQKKILSNCNAVGVGMGLGTAEFKRELLRIFPCVIDADLCYKKEIIEFLQSNARTIITPHPKEFAALLSLIKNKKISVDDVQKERFILAREFSIATCSTLVLKGANTIIARDGQLFVCPLGTNALAKGGSGDVLAGLITGLLAQGYSALDAAVNGVLAHALAGRNFAKNSYALNPLDIIEEIKCLPKN